MECCKCISMKKAGRRSSMKSHFHGFAGLGGARRPVDVCSARIGVERRPSPTSKNASVYTGALLANLQN